MPEEKKENKAAAKDSFTFSDKIKNSKPAASKSFANRISSKIGSDGKPKKTLFERTKRDAPFFIAAIVALLLLPFLYKYSGSVDEDPTMVTPATEDTLFDPNRSGFDGIGDPEGQIAQLSGRDSMDLIVGFGNKQEEVSEELPIRNDLERSGLDENYSSSNTAKEYNEKNVYRYKKQAAPATKAAFKKTNINPLRGAGLTSRGGGKLGVGMWGGGLKQAANKVKADAPKSSPKPVSLQPLQAAGKPSRSYFGQGAAAEARRSKDAMSKANAMQALMDAQMKPIEPGKIGGIGGGDFGGPGGGNGNLDRKFAFNGKEPWWWDMMKKRSQMEWEAKFNRKWDWIKFGDKLAQQLLDGLLSCLITGNDDWSMGKIGGAVADAGSKDKCNGLTKDMWESMHKEDGIPFGKKYCRAFYGYGVKKDVEDPWEGGNSSDVDLNFFQARWDCLTNGAFAARKARKAGEGVVTEANSCASFYQNGRYLAGVGGDYALYHYVVGVRAEDWADYVKQNSDKERKEYLSIGYFRSGAGFSIDPTRPTQFMNNRGFIPLFVESVAVKNKKIDKKKTAKAEEGLLDDKVSYKGYWGTGGTKQGTCGNFGPTPYKEAVKLCAAKKPALTCRKDCMDSINSQIRGKNKVKALNVISAEAGMPYSSFMELLREGGLMTDSGDGKDNLSLAAKGGKEGKDWATGARCAYPLAFASCHQNAELKSDSDSGETNAQGAPAAFISMPNIGKMDKKFYDEVKKLFMVTYKIAGKDEASVANTTTTIETSDKGRAFFVQTLEPAEGYAAGVVGPKPQGPLSAKFNVAASGHGLAMAQDLMKHEGNAVSRAIITWEVRQIFDKVTPWSMGRTIQDGAGRSTPDGTPVNGRDLPGEIVSTATCVYGDEGPVSTGVPDNECPQGKNTSEECCKKLGGDNYEWDGKQCKLKDTAECPQGKHTNAECCAKLGDPNDVWQNGKCAPLPPVNECPNGKDTNEACCLKLGKGQYHWKDGQCVFNGMVHLAPVIEWVPSDISARLPVVSGQNLTAQNFTGGQAIPTKNDSQHCGAEMGRIMIESTAATKFANDVVDAYNAKYSEKPMATVSASYPTMGEFVDALYVANQLGISDVPKDAVCMLGQAMAQVSRDKHAGSLTWGDNRPFFNELGSYLAYVHPEAAYYPAKYYETATNCDKRFLAVAEAGCPATILVPGVKGHREFHHSNYAWNSNTSKYLASLTPGMKQYPLRALAEGVSFSATGCTKGCGPKRKEYNRTFKFLLRGQCPQGNMQVADALKYVTAVCSTGLDYKPQGSPGNASGPSSDNSGSSGNNNSVRGK
ncbi:MAG: hypothetical protein J6J74_03580 [Elusimicrobiaceae bacterium]|nr:hypothetical protein [Elusimicrobiaceae bacterium]